MAKIRKIMQTEVITYVCDQCEREAKRLRHCYGCHQEVCPQCYSLLYDHPFTGDSYSDYSEPICVPCKKILQPFMQKAKELNEQHEQEIDSLSETFKKKCKAEV